MKKEYFILFALIIGLSVYLMMRETDKIEYELPEVPQIARKDISRIEIQNEKGSVELKRQDGRWVIGDKAYAADVSKVNAMLQAIEELRLTAMVSEAQNYDRYDLSDPKKITVRAFGKEKEKIEFDMGKPAATNRHTFVRIPEDKRVFHAAGNFRRAFDADLEALRDKQVMAFNPRDISAVRFKTPKNELALKIKPVPPKPEKAETADAADNKADSNDPNAPQRDPENSPPREWETATGEPADSDEIEALLTELSDLRCKEFIYDKGKADFNNPIYRIELTGDSEYTVAVFDRQSEAAEEFPATSSTGSDPFVLPKWQAEKIMPDFTKLLKAAQETEDGKAVPPAAQSKPGKEKAKPE